MKDEVHVKNKLPKICSKLIFKLNAIKISDGKYFHFTSNFYKETDGCTMGGPLSVLFSYIYIYISPNQKVKLSIHPNLNFTKGSWMILLIGEIGEIKINLTTCFRNITATIQLM